MFERFTGDARRAVVLAQEQALRLGHDYIGTEHLLLGVVSLPAEVGACRVLYQLGFTADTVRAAVEQIVGSGTAGRERAGGIPFTARAKQVLELSLREALRMGSNHIGPEHLVLAILAEGGGVAAQVLGQQVRSLDEIRAAIGAAVRSGEVPSLGALRTPAADQVIALAEQLAGGSPVGTHHLLEAITRMDSSMAGKVLASLGVTTDAVTGGVEGLDPTETGDVTPEQAAAATMRWTVDAGTATLVTTEPELVERLRRLVEDAGGELTGRGTLAGPFVGLHLAMSEAADEMDTIVHPPDPASGAADRQRIAVPSARFRVQMRRRRRR